MFRINISTELTSTEALALLPFTTMKEFRKLCLVMGKQWTLTYAPGVAVEFGLASEEEVRELWDVETNARKQE
jgi:hypothetical protein